MLLWWKQSKSVSFLPSPRPRSQQSCTIDLSYPTTVPIPCPKENKWKYINFKEEPGQDLQWEKVIPPHAVAAAAVNSMTPTTPAAIAVLTFLQYIVRLRFRDARSNRKACWLSWSVLSTNNCQKRTHVGLRVSILYNHMAARSSHFTPHIALT